MGQRGGVGQARRRRRKVSHQGLARFVSGRLSTTSWDDKTSGQKRYKTEVTAEKVILCGEKRESKAADVDRVDDFVDNSFDAGDTSPGDDDIPF